MRSGYTTKSRKGCWKNRTVKYFPRKRLGMLEAIQRTYQCMNDEKFDRHCRPLD
jgi:hypothetical protein